MRILFVTVGMTMLLSACNPSGLSDPTDPDPNPAPLPSMVTSPAPQVSPPVTAPTPPELVDYEGPVEHIFFHPLIVYPELAFDGDSLSQGYNDWFITVLEFKRIVEQLYQNDYVLVNIDQLYETRMQANRPTYAHQTLRLPKGKRPLVLSVDDLNYYTYMRENGNAHRLALDEEGNVATYVVPPDAQPKITRDGGIVPILDDFVARHPDFSFQGAKGVLALTGYEGILGYATHDQNSPQYEREKAAALRVVSRLKETGWTFASHSWGHLSASKISTANLVQDTLRWKAEVEPLVGVTHVYIYPFGSRVETDDSRFEALNTLGFGIFCGIGPDLALQISNRYVLMDRKRVDGLALQTQARMLKDLVDPATVLDPSRPTPGGSPEGPPS
jgi:hypothetical protein